MAGTPHSRLFLSGTASTAADSDHAAPRGGPRAKYFLRKCSKLLCPIHNISDSVVLLTFIRLQLRQSVVSSNFEEVASLLQVFWQSGAVLAFRDQLRGNSVVVDAVRRLDHALYESLLSALVPDVLQFILPV